VQGNNLSGLKMEEKPKKLENYQEIIGVLKKVQNQDGRIIMTFNITIKVKLIDSPKLIENLKQYIGKKIGIIRADSKYIVKKIGER